MFGDFNIISKVDLKFIFRNKVAVVIIINSQP